MDEKDAKLVREIAEGKEFDTVEGMRALAKALVAAGIVPTADEKKRPAGSTPSGKK